MNSSLAPQLRHWDSGDVNPICREGDSEEEPHSLRLRLGPPLPPHGCFTCGKLDTFEDDTFHYYCSICDIQFHRHFCHRYPPKRRHPYHLQHPLSFSFVLTDGFLFSHSNFRDFLEVYSHVLADPAECYWCGKRVSDFFYGCSLCGFVLCPHCSEQYPRLTITNLHSHPHPLAFFPRPLLSPCDACGLADARHWDGTPSEAYTCLKCNYIAHQSCLNLPHVIKITRHPHRLSHDTFLSRGNWTCGVCHRSIDPNHGAFSCVKGCFYALHSKCATRDDIWDGLELEGEPEEPPEDIEPFVEIGDGKILHFGHAAHPMHLIEDDGDVLDGNDQCGACVLPIGRGSFYGCIPCGFFLHLKCASLPRKKCHELHRHPLVLDPLPDRDLDPIRCSVCPRGLSGFTYRCTEEDCRDRFRLDVRCISVPDPCDHKSHQHPLFITFDISMWISCNICGGIHLTNFLKCHEGCDFVMCFNCATHEVSYKFYGHPIKLSCGEEESRSTYWCEDCEEKIDPKEWFYECEECCDVTLHVVCVFGPSVYMKVGHSFNYYGRKVEIVQNSTTRPFCGVCGGRCRGTILYEEMDRDGNVMSYCCSFCGYVYFN